MKDASNKAAGNNNRLALVLIFAIPVLIILSSTALYYLAEHKVLDLGEVSRGELITPPLPIAQLQLVDGEGQALAYELPEPLWTYVIFGDADCEQLCERVLYVTGQTHKLLGRKVNDLQRIYVNTGGEPGPALQVRLEGEHKNLRVVNGDREEISLALANLEIDPMADTVFFLVDPRGWMMMYYVLADDRQQTLSQLSKDMIKDLKRLIP